MLTLRHQQIRYLFQILWVLVFVVLLLSDAGSKVWTGLLLAGVASALLFKRAACSFVCPVFPIGELLWRTGARRCGRNFAPPFWLDLALRAAKYLVLGWLVLALYDGELYDMHVGARHAVPLLIAAILALSLFVQHPWCRYLCPYGALLGITSIASLTKIRRYPRHCVRCHKCSNRCPASLPVMLRTTVRSPECFACYRCVDGCPAPGALAMVTPGNRAVPAWLVGIMLSGMLLAGLGLAIVI
jgi:polyferredoxin